MPGENSLSACSSHASALTTATGERSFSELKYAKNYLRSTMTEVRVNGLAHIFISRDIKLNYDVIIDMFVKKNRRLEF